MIHSQVDSIASITGIGNGDGIFSTTVVSEGGIGPISGQTDRQGNGINGGSLTPTVLRVQPPVPSARLPARGGPPAAMGSSEPASRPPARSLGSVVLPTPMAETPSIRSQRPREVYGDIDATVLGGQLGNGIFDSTIRAWTELRNELARHPARGDQRQCSVGAGAGHNGYGCFCERRPGRHQRNRANAAAISASTFTVSQGDFGSIYAQSINSGNAIENCTFTANNGSITTATDLASVAASGITAIAGGTSPASNAISGSTFVAD